MVPQRKFAMAKRLNELHGYEEMYKLKCFAIKFFIRLQNL